MDATEADDRPGGECADCKHCVRWECRRMPPVLTMGRVPFDERWLEPEWEFPPSGKRCGQFEQEVR